MLLTITAHRIKRQERKNAESYLKSREYTFEDSSLNDVFVRLIKYAAKRVMDQRNKKSSGGARNLITGTRCSCRFYCQWELPCVHLLHRVQSGNLTPDELLKNSTWLN